MTQRDLNDRFFELRNKMACSAKLECPIEVTGNFQVWLSQKNEVDLSLGKLETLLEKAEKMLQLPQYRLPLITFSDKQHLDDPLNSLIQDATLLMSNIKLKIEKLDCSDILQKEVSLRFITLLTKLAEKFAQVQESHVRGTERWHNEVLPKIRSVNDGLCSYDWRQGIKPGRSSYAQLPEQETNETSGLTESFIGDRVDDSLTQNSRIEKQLHWDRRETMHKIEKDTRELANIMAQLKLQVEIQAENIKPIEDAIQNSSHAIAKGKMHLESKISRMQRIQLLGGVILTFLIIICILILQLAF